MNDEKLRKLYKKSVDSEPVNMDLKAQLMAMAKQVKEAEENGGSAEDVLGPDTDNAINTPIAETEVFAASIARRKRIRNTIMSITALAACLTLCVVAAPKLSEYMNRNNGGDDGVIKTVTSDGTPAPGMPETSAATAAPDTQGTQSTPPQMEQNSAPKTGQSAGTQDAAAPRTNGNTGTQNAAAPQSGGNSLVSEKSRESNGGASVSPSTQPIMGRGYATPSNAPAHSPDTGTQDGVNNFKPPSLPASSDDEPTKGSQNSSLDKRKEKLMAKAWGRYNDFEALRNNDRYINAEQSLQAAYNAALSDFNDGCIKLETEVDKAKTATSVMIAEQEYYQGKLDENGTLTQKCRQAYDDLSEDGNTRPEAVGEDRKEENEPDTSGEAQTKNGVSAGAKAGNSAEDKEISEAESVAGNDSEEKKTGTSDAGSNAEKEENNEKID